MRLLIALLGLFLLAGCGGAKRTAAGPYEKLDDSTEYRIEPAPQGFTAHVVYAEQQFVPRQTMTVESAVQAAKQVAARHARANGKQLAPIADTDYRYHVDRNGISGTTSVAVVLDARWL